MLLKASTNVATGICQKLFLVNSRHCCCGCLSRPFLGPLKEVCSVFVFKPPPLTAHFRSGGFIFSIGGQKIKIFFESIFISRKHVLPSE
jgi:hypothetical protein